MLQSAVMAFASAAPWHTVPCPTRSPCFGTVLKFYSRLLALTALEAQAILSR